MKYEIVSRQGDLRRHSCIVIPVYSDVRPKDVSYAGMLSKLFSIDLGKIRSEEKFAGGDSEELLLRVASRGGLRRILFVGFGKQRMASTVLIRRRMLRAGLAVRARGYRDPVIILPDYPPSGQKDGMEAALVGFSLGLARPLRYKTSQKEEAAAVAKISVYHPDVKDKNLLEAIRSAAVITPIVSQVRNLVDEPANLLGPEELARRVGQLVGGKGVEVKIHRPKERDRKGFPMVYEVGKGSARPPLVVEMSYRPRAEGKLRSVVLIGKGVIFDTGGLNLKPFHNMGGMKNDMAGAASVAGVMAAASDMDLRVNLTALLPLAENTPSSRSYRPGDVLTSRSGKTVEVTSTDAEGRLLVADALTFAAEKKPDYVIDVATLTGACIVALGNFVGGLFASDDLLAKMIEEAASSAGELIWRLPLVEEMVPSIRSDIADLRNTMTDSYGGAIGGALFLREFAGSAPWAHLDIAGPAFFDKRTEVGPKGATGYGVHTLVRLLQRLSKHA